MTPKLDPSGTSWLPFPFWTLGGALMLVGRSLPRATLASIVLASVAAPLPYLALRAIGTPRARALAGCILAFGTPWAVWFGAATVPESMTASLGVAAIVGTVGVMRRLRDPSSFGSSLGWSLMVGLSMAAACLSRYEAWPLAAVVALGLALASVRAERSHRFVGLAAAALCVAGPLAWMAWNAHAHDGPLHFFRRVSNYKRALGDDSTPWLSALTLYPRLLVTTRPELSLGALLLLPTLRRPDIRATWGLPVLAVLAQLAFLTYGSLSDGAPTHHPERALWGAFVILALFVANVALLQIARIRESQRRLAVVLTHAAFMTIWLSAIWRGRTPPGMGASEDRSLQVAQGAQLAAQGVKAFEVVPCAYEHFALLAAYGAPERVLVLPRGDAPVQPLQECPSVRQR